MVIEELIALLGFDLKGEGNLNRFVAGLTRATSALAAFAARAAAFAAAAATAIGGGLALLGKGAVNVGAEFEDLLAVLETIEGSSEKAKSSLNWVEDFATKTPYDLKTVADAFVSLKAYGLDPIPGLLESIGNASSAMNKPLQQGVEAIADAVRGENERLKEFGVVGKKAGDQITYTWSQNGKELTKTVKNNAVEIQRALQEIFDARFLGAMDKRSKTFNGIVANIGDTWNKFLLRIADAGWFDFVKTQFDNFLSYLNVLKDNGTLDVLAKSISDTLVAAGTALKDLVSSVTLEDVTGFINGSIQFLMGLGRVIASVFQAVKAIGQFVSELLGLQSTWKGVAIALGAAGLIVAPVATAFAAIALIIDDFIAWLQGRPSLIGEAVEAIRSQFSRLSTNLDASPFGKFISGIKSAFENFDVVGYFRRWSESINTLGSAFGKISSSIGSITDNIGKLFSLAGQGDGTSAFGKMAEGLGKLVGGNLVAGLEGLAGTVKIIADSLDTFGNVMQKFSAGDFYGGLKEYGKGFKTVADDIVATIERIIQAFSPDFSFKGAWDAVLSYFEGFATTLENTIKRISAALDTVKASLGMSTTVEGGAEPERKTPREWVKDWWGGGDTPPSAEPETNLETIVDPPAEDNDNSLTFSNIIRDLMKPIPRMAAQTADVAGTGGAEKVGDTVANDNRVTNTEINVSAPVQITATTMATPGEIGSAAGAGVRAAGDTVARNLAVTANPGTVAK